MTSEWRTLPLGEFMTFQRGFDLPVKDRSGGDIPVIGSTGPVGFHDQAKVEGPGVVIGRSGSLGGAQFFREAFWPLNTTLWVKNFHGNDPRFCYYLLHTLDLAIHNSGSGVPTLNRNHIHPLPITVPVRRREQESISSVLGALDDKIELNRRMSETLDRMAETMFKEWFISSPTTQEEDNVQAPNHLRDVLTLAYGKGLRKADRVPGPVPVYGSGGAFDYHNEALIGGPAIIVGRKGTVGSLYWVDEPSFPGDTVFYVESAQPLTYCFYLLRTLGLNEMNTDAAVPGLNRENAYRLEVPSPPASLIEQFDSVAAPIRERVRIANVESRTLAGLRDTLLPKLISGELRIPEAEQLVSEVA